MEHRTSTSWQRSAIGKLLVSLSVLGGCTRGERAAPASGSAGSTASSKTVGQQSPAALGFDSLITQQRPGATCYAGARYVVVARDADEVGSDLYVRTRGVSDAAPRCDADSIGGDIVFRTGAAASHHPDAQHFLGLKGDLLVAWDGTGGASDLYIYDLIKRAKVLVVEGTDNDNVEWLSPTTVTVWVTKAYEEGAVKAGCPDTIPANPPKMDSLMTLDLQTLVLRPSGRYRCGVGQ